MAVVWNTDINEAGLFGFTVRQIHDLPTVGGKDTQVFELVDWKGSRVIAMAEVDEDDVVVMMVCDDPDVSPVFRAILLEIVQSQKHNPTCGGK